MGEIDGTGVGAIILGCTGLVGIASVLIKFVIDSVFKNLQRQIDRLHAEGLARQADIQQLNEALGEWREKYQQLAVEHASLQEQHKFLQREFDVFRANSKK